MKANEAPEKIYLDIEPNLDDCTWHLTNPNGDSIEYTRTDAFVEKACAWFRKIDYDDTIPPFETTEEFIKEFKKAITL